MMSMRTEKVANRKFLDNSITKHIIKVPVLVEPKIVSIF